MRNKLLFVLLAGILSSCQPDFSDQALSGVCHSLREEQKEITKKIWSVRRRAKIEIYENGAKPSDMHVLYYLEKSADMMDPVLRYLDSLYVYDSLGKAAIHYPETFFRNATSFSDSLGAYGKGEDQQKSFRQLLAEQENVFQKINLLNGSAREVQLLISKNKFLFHELIFERDLAMSVAGSHCGYWPIMIPVVEPESKIVEDGNTYRASIYFGLGYSMVYPEEAKLDGEAIPIKPGLNGKVPVRIPASELAEQDSIVKKHWKMAVKVFDKEYLNDTTIIVERDYFVRKSCK